MHTSVVVLVYFCYVGRKCTFETHAYCSKPSSFTIIKQSRNQITYEGIIVGSKRVPLNPGSLHCRKASSHAVNYEERQKHIDMRQLRNQQTKGQPVTKLSKITAFSHRQNSCRTDIGAKHTCSGAGRSEIRDWRRAEAFGLVRRVVSSTPRRGQSMLCTDFCALCHHGFRFSFSAEFFRVYLVEYTRSPCVHTSTPSFCTVGEKDHGKCAMRISGWFLIFFTVHTKHNQQSPRVPRDDRQPISPERRRIGP